MFNLALKSLEALKFDKIQVEKRNRRSQATVFEAGRFKFSKENRIPQRRTRETSCSPHGRSVDRGINFFPSYFLCINKSFSYGKRVANHLYKILKHSKYRHEKKES